MSSLKDTLTVDCGLWTVDCGLWTGHACCSILSDAGSAHQLSVLLLIQSTQGRLSGVWCGMHDVRAV